MKLSMGSSQSLLRDPKLSGNSTKVIMRLQRCGNKSSEILRPPCSPYVGFIRQASTSCSGNAATMASDKSHSSAFINDPRGSKARRQPKPAQPSQGRPLTGSKHLFSAQDNQHPALAPSQLKSCINRSFRKNRLLLQRIPL